MTTLKDVKDLSEDIKKKFYGLDILFALGLISIGYYTYLTYISVVNAPADFNILWTAWCAGLTLSPIDYYFWGGMIAISVSLALMLTHK
jgi:hypothetical protein